MLGWLRTIVDWIFGRPSSLIQLSLQATNTYGASSNRWEGPDPPKRPYDPDSPVRSPRRSPVLVGHSMSGGEMTTLGRQHSDRIAGLVYLDALGDLEDEPPADPEWA